jgi:hypothetical protein
MNERGEGGKGQQQVMEVLPSGVISSYSYRRSRKYDTAASANVKRKKHSITIGLVGNYNSRYINML